MNDEKRIVLFSLSTCPACKKTKDLLNKCGVDYLSVDLDVIDIDSREKLLEKVRQYNPRETFPTLVIDGGKNVIVGFNDEELKDALKLRY